MENQNFKGIQQSNVQIQRQVAYKCWLSNLNNGKFIAGVNTPENFTPAHLICNGKKIAKSKTNNPTIICILKFNSLLKTITTP